ncbi:DUF664 domain-containing protein [Serinicoccus sp. LYQ131]|uniref:mycothiol transferase n=1 Tax=Serinicoccus sp. LYQ131 TaxID=3378797 RepID=UPI003852D0EF
MERSVLGQFVIAKLDEMIDVVAGMDATDVNVVPALPGANSAYQILYHCLGMAAQWTREDVLGLPTGRDRSVEFQQAGDVDGLIVQARAVRAQLLVDLASMRHDQAPSSLARARDTFWVGSAEGILLHVLEELCQHFGHLEITRDLVAGKAA